MMTKLITFHLIAHNPIIGSSLFCYIAFGFHITVGNIEFVEVTEVTVFRNEHFVKSLSHPLLSLLCLYSATQRG